jgi:LuxR family transcriptional regulator, maltose regulon positive regulatory protein
VGSGRGGQRPILSERELIVLALLPSMLSLDDIAADLMVSVNTVKNHVRAIFSKLGVSSRRLAVLTAHERGLLHQHPVTRVPVSATRPDRPLNRR